MSNKDVMVAKPWSKLFKRKKIISKLIYFHYPSQKDPNRTYTALSKEVAKFKAKK